MATDPRRWPVAASPSLRLMVKAGRGWIQVTLVDTGQCPSHPRRGGLRPSQDQQVPALDALGETRRYDQHRA